MNSEEGGIRCAAVYPQWVYCIGVWGTRTCDDALGSLLSRRQYMWVRESPVECDQMHIVRGVASGVRRRAPCCMYSRLSMSPSIYLCV
jgi:hypothetical protein